MWANLITVFLMSGLKYLVGAAWALGSFAHYFSPRTAHFIGFFISTAGGIAGIFVFTYGILWIEEAFKHRFLKKGKHFNKRTRLLVRLKRGGGLPLVALLTPVLLSIPLGCIMATTFIHSRKRIVFFMSLSVVFWGVIIFGSAMLFVSRI